MIITILDKINILIKTWGIINLLPNYKMKIKHFLNPIDAVRYLEFSYLYKFLSKNNLKDLNILDASSPYIMAYILTANNQIISTNINERESENFKQTPKLKFELQDTTTLPYYINQFDLVYSISVVEHIYDNYIQAIKEMIRVTKNGGYIYLTFPVSKKYTEEWQEYNEYGHQHEKNKKFFFQYRFDEKYVDNFLSQIKNVEIVSKDIFWEKINNSYNTMIKLANFNTRIKPLNILKNSLINYLYGFSLFSKKPEANFNKAKNFGNMHLILKKIIQ